MEKKVSNKIRGNKILLIAIILGMLIILFYYPAFDNYFLSDDFTYVRLCDVHSLTEITHLFSPGYPQNIWKNVDYDYGIPSGYGFSRPVQNIYFALMNKIFGYNPGGYRLVSVVIFWFTAFLVFIFIYLLSKNYLLASITSILFALNPLRNMYIHFIITEGGMVWVFFLLALILYILSRANHQKNIKYHLFILLSLFCALVAFFNSELTMNLVFVILLVEYFMAKKFKRWTFDIKYCLPYFGIAAFYFVVRWQMLGGLGASQGVYDLTNISFWIQNAVLSTIWLFVPSDVGFLVGIKSFFFGDIPAKIIIAENIFLFIAIGLIIAIGAIYILFKFLKTYKTKRYPQDVNYNLIIFSVLWIIVTMIPTGHWRHLQISLIGSMLLISICIVLFCSYIAKYIKIDRKVIVSIIVIAILFGYYFVNIPYVEVYELGDRITINTIGTTMKVIENSTNMDKPIIVYYLGIPTHINSCGIGVNGLSEALQMASKRDDLRVKNVYLIYYQSIEDYKNAMSPVIKQIDNKTIMVTNIGNLSLDFGHFNYQNIKEGLILKNGKYYTVEVISIESLSGNKVVKKMKIHFNDINEETFCFVYDSGIDNIELLKNSNITDSGKEWEMKNAKEDLP